MDTLPPAADPTPLTAIPVNTFERHNRCLTCGYDLFGQPRIGLCPECGNSTRETAAHAQFLSHPDKVACVLSGARLLLIASILSGLCPGVCLLMLATDGSGVVAGMMTVIFVTTAVTAAVGDRRLLGADEVVGVDRQALLTRRMFDGIAAAGLVTLNLAAFVIATGIDSAMIAVIVAIGFFLLSISAWRAAPTGSAHARVGEVGWGRAGGLRGLGVIKAFYESIWLGCCWMGIACLAVNQDAAVFFMFAAFFGLFGFAAIWIAMIVVSALFLQRISRLATGTRGFDVMATQPIG